MTLESSCYNDKPEVVIFVNLYRQETSSAVLCSSIGARARPCIYVFDCDLSDSRQVLPVAQGIQNIHFAMKGA